MSCAGYEPALLAEREALLKAGEREVTTVLREARGAGRRNARLTGLFDRPTLESQR